jgi:hypothetical protein
MIWKVLGGVEKPLEALRSTTMNRSGPVQSRRWRVPELELQLGNLKI